MNIFQSTVISLYRNLHISTVTSLSYRMGELETTLLPDPTAAHAMRPDLEYWKHYIIPMKAFQSQEISYF